MITRFFRRWGGAGLALVLLLPLLIGVALAQAPDLSACGSITIALRDTTENHTPIPNAHILLFRVAEVSSQEGHLSYTYTQEFEGNGMGLEDLNAQGLAVHLYQFAQSMDIKTHGEGLTAADGKVLFEDLPVGLYLAAQLGTVEGFYQVEPFLVALPVTNEEGTGWDYHIQAVPKVEPTPQIPQEYVQLTVRKEWVNPTSSMPKSITVALLRDDEVFETCVLSQENDWQYSWTKLESGYRWNVVELDVPNNCHVSYTPEGDVVTITNTIHTDTTSLTVKKLWNDAGENRPESISVQLLRDDSVVDEVVLSQQNQWSYTWYDLAPDSRWTVQEKQVPQGYKVSYSYEDQLVTITNAKTLIQTGQLNWPIPVLVLVGLTLLTLGWVIAFGKRKHSREA